MGHISVLPFNIRVISRQPFQLCVKSIISKMGVILIRLLIMIQLKWPQQYDIHCKHDINVNCYSNYLTGWLF